MRDGDLDRCPQDRGESVLRHWRAPSAAGPVGALLVGRACRPRLRLPLQYHRWPLQRQLAHEYGWTREKVEEATTIFRARIPMFTWWPAPHREGMSGSGAHPYGQARRPVCPTRGHAHRSGTSRWSRACPWLAVDTTPLRPHSLGPTVGRIAGGRRLTSADNADFNNRREGISFQCRSRTGLSPYRYSSAVCWLARAAFRSLQYHEE